METNIKITQSTMASQRAYDPTKMTPMHPRNHMPPRARKETRTLKDQISRHNEKPKYAKPTPTKIAPQNTTFRRKKISYSSRRSWPIWKPNYFLHFTYWTMSY